MVQVRSAMTRQRILLSAARIINERNYECAPISEIADQAGVTTGAVYFHFRTKEAIAHAVIEAQHALSRENAERITSVDGPTMEKILAVSAEFTQSIVENQLVRAGIRLTTEVNMFRQPPLLPWAEWSALNVELLTRAMCEGDVKRGVDVAAYAELITAAYAGTQLLSGLVTDRRDLPLRIFRMWTILIDGFTPPERIDFWLGRARELFLVS